MNSAFANGPGVRAQLQENGDCQRVAPRNSGGSTTLTSNLVLAERAAAARRGVTLSEVLMSLLVMSIGVLGVATLFPLSVFRTIQATQLTNGAQLRYNFEGLTGPRPELIAGAGVWQAFDATLLPSYSRGDLVVGSSPSSVFYECVTAGQQGAVEPTWAGIGSNTTDFNAAWTTHLARVYVVDPLGWEAGTKQFVESGFNPTVNQANIRNSFGRKSLSTTPYTRLLDSPHRIVRFRGGAASTAALPSNPSNSVFPFPPFATANTAPFVNYQTASGLGALASAVLPDSWIVDSDSTDLSLPAAPVTFVQLLNQSATVVQMFDANGDGTLDFTPGTGAEQNIIARATLFDATGKQSVVRPLTSVTNPSAGVDQLNWATALPTGFVPVRVRFERFDQRYTWMLAVGRTQSAYPNGGPYQNNQQATYQNLVVFFRRAYGPEEELIHPANFNAGVWAGADNLVGTQDDVADLKFDGLGNVSAVLRVGPDGQPGKSGVDDDGNGTTDDFSELGFGDDIIPKPLVVISYHTDPSADSPFLKRGGFICDAENNHWYRILKYTEVANPVLSQTALHAASATALSGPFRSPYGGAVVWLEDVVYDGSGIYSANGSNFPNGDPTEAGGAILMPGVVDVYPLQPKTPWEQ